MQKSAPLNCDIRRAKSAAALLGCTSVLALTVGAQAQTILPRGGSVAAGQVSIGAVNGNALSINQGSPKAIVNWDSFSIGSNAVVNFVQPNASASILNRVTGDTPSTIAGQINANGQVFLVNPNGIAITRSGTVAVGGGFIASTLDISNAGFWTGQFNFTGKGSSAAVSNDGTISGASGSFVGLIGGAVTNSGTIKVPLGKIGLGAGEKVTLDPNGDGFLQIAVPTTAKTADGRALIDVAGQINAAGGSVEIKAATAQQAVHDVVNISGQISANSVSGRPGNIVLDGGGGSVSVSGKLAANGDNRNKGGTIVATGHKVTLTSTAQVSADGASGGNVLIGGDMRGGLDPSAKLITAPVRTSAATLVSQGAVISADGSAGDGGNVVVWSNGQTDFGGRIQATGAGAGKGGAVEVSSHSLLNFTGAVDVTAKNGKTGTLLLDPYDVTISSGSDTNISNVSNTFSPTGNSSILSVTTLQNALATANVTVNTGASGAQSGNITVANAVSWSANTSLTLTAAGAIILNAGITNSGATSGLTLTANGAAGISGAGNLANSGTLTLNVASGGSGTLSGVISGSGSLTFAGPGSLTLSGANTYTGTTTVSGGTLEFSNEVSLYNNTPASWTATNIIVGSGATLALAYGGAGQFTSSDVQTISALGTASGGFKSGSFLGLDTSSGNATYANVIANTNAGGNTLGLVKLGSNIRAPDTG